MTRTALIGSPPLGTDVPGDGVKPWPKIRDLPDLFESPERPDEGLLAGVLSFGL